jgi:hypothetical protein
MPFQLLPRWLLQTVAAVVCITLLWALGAAAFGLLCGGLGLLIGMEKMPIGLLWVTTSGAITGFLVAALWAIDQSTNWPYFLPPLPDHSPCEPLPRQATAQAVRAGSALKPRPAPPPSFPERIAWPSAPNRTAR